VRHSVLVICSVHVPCNACVVNKAVLLKAKRLLLCGHTKLEGTSRLPPHAVLAVPTVLTVFVHCFPPTLHNSGQLQYWH